MHILLASSLGAVSTLFDTLRRHGHGCDLAEPFLDAPSIAQHSGDYDCILVETANISRDGVGMVRDIRRKGVRCPVLVLGARVSAEEEQAVLEAGADQVLTGPLHMPLLQARMQAVLRRCLGHASPELRCGNVVLDQARRTVTVDGAPVRITCREFDVLEMLMLRPGAMLTKEHFMARAYGLEDGPDQRILDVFICKLRRKLAAAGSAEIVRTIWGRGYVLEEPGASEVIAARARLAAAHPRMQRAHLVRQPPHLAIAV
ncbi:response regulator transcription factor [Teichococcus oryzae]|uniref:Response regulator transcription factor n=1 Tax=Teichococcus oryzae TaxID=1608942 RepID=A0A5B2TDD0_9PROT|nr:response regulator transcription factor [Pseudoroseomonas oryzae]KAA2212103.1 response regulator transcription factor [Pseudoroseomonas oryzae]